MSTEAQLEANARNAQASTGPRTDAGKAASSRNATKHGLSAAFAVLPHENQQEFDELIEDVRAEHQPVNNHQTFLTQQLAKTWWLLARAQRLEAKAFEHLAGFIEEPEDDPDARIVAALFKSNPSALTTLQRYSAQAERSYYKAYRELKLAKQIQNEANAVRKFDSSPDPVTDRIVKGPVPTHPAYDEPACQYGTQAMNHPAPAASRTCAP